MKKIDHSIKVPRIYKAASKIAKTVKEDGGSLKNLIYTSKHTNIKGLYALIIKTLQKEDVLDRLINKTKILVNEDKADPWLIRVLITELLFGRKILAGNSKPVQTVLSYQNALLKQLKKQKKKGTISLDSDQIQDSIPRCVRVNTLLLSVADALEYFQNEGWKLIRRKGIRNYKTFLERVSSLEENQFIEDYHIEELLIFPSKTEFFQHELFLNGSIILQDKASCLASWLLNPTPDSTTLDMCAAPGMKTTHLAAIMQNKGTLHAVEMNDKRYKVLCEQIEKSGAKCVKTYKKDALLVDAETCEGVEFILIDPSCSGSGMVGRPKITTEEKNAERLEKLAGFQIKLLCHALTNFPDVKRVVYSTCSIHEEENEQVVKRALEIVNSDPENPIFQVADNILEGKWLHRGSDNYEWGPRCLYARSDVDFTNGFFVAVFDRDASKEIKVNPQNKLKKKGHKRRKSKTNSILNASVDSEHQENAIISNKVEKTVNSSFSKKKRQKKNEKGYEDVVEQKNETPVTSNLGTENDISLNNKIKSSKKKKLRDDSTICTENRSFQESLEENHVRDSDVRKSSKKTIKHEESMTISDDKILSESNEAKLSEKRKRKRESSNFETPEFGKKYKKKKYDEFNIKGNELEKSAKKKKKSTVE